jgi:RNA polymerase sigma factor (sigma-70 family)
MTAALAQPPGAVADPVVDRAVAGDDAAFVVLVERHRSELHRHCRKLLTSSERAEDALQETLLRAWRARSTFAGRASFRTWLYRIATNSCLDEMCRDRRRPRRLGPASWPDTVADPSCEPVSTDPGPDALLEASEAVETACRTMIELLPPKQRAVLILCDVLRCSSGEAAQVLGTTVAAVNSARQRARATLHGPRPAATLEQRPDPRLRATERALLERYVDALRRYDVATVIAVAKADAARVAAGGSRATATIPVPATPPYSRPVALSWRASPAPSGAHTHGRPCRFAEADPSAGAGRPPASTDCVGDSCRIATAATLSGCDATKSP